MEPGFSGNLGIPVGVAREGVTDFTPGRSATMSRDGVDPRHPM